MNPERAQRIEERGLQDLAAGVFSLILSLRTSSDYGGEEELRRRITAYLDSVEREGLEQGLPRDDVEALKFPLVAFIDETILHSSWEHRERWRDRPLQLDLFGELRAGIRFFDQLDQVRRGGEAKRDLLEVYHLCLTLGFEGKYRISGREKLQPLIDEIRRELGYSTRYSREIRLSPHGKKRDDPIGGQGDRLPRWRIVAIGAGALLVLFVIGKLLLEGAAARALRALPMP